MTHPKILEIAKLVIAKRPRTVIEHLMQHGSITNETLKDIYGYNHPPRAIRDVRECGIPIVTERVTGSDGRRIAMYKFGDPDSIENFKLGGRQTFSKKFKDDLVAFYGSVDCITGASYESRYLQIDHRIPFEIAGEEIGGEQNLDKFMLLTGSSQRQKSWSCENCQNFKKKKLYEVCATCYWASPEDYEHVAMRHMKQVTVTLEGDSYYLYKKLLDYCLVHNVEINTVIVNCLEDYLKKEGDI